VADHASGYATHRRQAGDTKPCREEVTRGERRPNVVSKEFTLGPGKTAVLTRMIAPVEQQGAST
jgi:hypothetical protein